MKKITISKEQSDALRTYISDNERELHSARYRLDGLSEFVEQGELPPTFLAFEILKQLALANENKFKSNQYLNVVPAHLVSETVEVPVSLLNILLDCWDEFTHSDPTKASFEKSFGFAASKRRGRPFLHKLEKLHDDRYYANKVIEARLRNYFKGTQISLTTAFTDTSFNEKVSYESVKNAWGKHRNFYKSMLRRLKVPEKLG
jgi:hypothetical protein